LLELLIVVGLTIHLLAVNLACAGPLVCIWLHCCGECGGLHDRLGKSLAWASLASLVLGILTGGVLVFVAPSAGLYEALGRFPVHAYWMAGIELVFSLACMLIYAISWKPLRRWRWRRWLHALISLLATSNLLYHFPPLMVVLGKLAVDPTWTSNAIVDRPTFRELMVRGDVLSLTTHFGLASFAVAAVAIITLLSRSKSDNQQQPIKQVARGAAALALLSSLLQVPVGVWILATLSGTERQALMGGDLLSSLLLVGGLLLTFHLLQRLVAVAMGEVDSGSLRRVGWLLVVLVLMMTATLRGSRREHAPTKTAAENTPPRLVQFDQKKSNDSSKRPYFFSFFSSSEPSGSF